MNTQPENTVGINIPLPDNKFYNTTYPRIVNGEYVSDHIWELFYHDTK